MKLRYLLTSVAVSALFLHAPALAQENKPEDSGEQTSETRKTQNNDENVLEPYFGRLSPFYGRLSPFEDDISPFWGRLSPFEDDEDLEPFWGRLSPFEGDIESFWGEMTPQPEGNDLEPFWGRISPFWGRLSPFWGRLSPFDDANDGDNESALQNLRELLEESEEFWGARIQEVSGQNFWEGFANEILAEFGIDLDDPSSLDNFTDQVRIAFMFAWYDGLMSFSGMDHVDHWMETANWSPALTQVQGMGTDTVIGLLDFTINSGDDLSDNVIIWSGNKEDENAHGSGVASLLVADHDGEGLMGIAPNASVALYNPFDEDGTANWTSITQGIIEVGSARASVVNLSLGVPGSVFDAEWAAVYGNEDIQGLLEQMVFVHAAGNDGVEQDFDVNLHFQNNPSLIFVGSVGPNGSISGFSNTPGDACLFAKYPGSCDVYLMDRFVVAPGEWILVTDADGGVTRRSGTSFAAPMVTGAIALLHDRWGWLKRYPYESAEIIFRSADDAGAPGVDEIYGHGILNITASQSPLDFELLYQLGTDSKGRTTKNFLGQMSDSELDAFLNTEGGYVTVMEDVGSTYRDFLIPLNSVVTGLGQSLNGDQEMLQNYLSDGLNSLGSRLKDETGKKKLVAGFVMDVKEFALPFAQTQNDDQLPFASELSITSVDGITFAFGNGVGAMSLTGDAGARVSRFEQQTGGNNPVLGLASGGGYSRIDIPVLGDAAFSIGTTYREFEDGYVDPFTGEWQLVDANRSVYEASAVHASIRKPLNSHVDLSLGYTRLDENNGALGTQSSLGGAFEGGTKTDAITIGSEWFLDEKISFTGTATFGDTYSRNATDGVALGSDGAQTSAFEAAINVTGLFSDADVGRLALVQPMHVESGTLAVTNYQVADRQTGALESVTNEFTLSDERLFAVEATWGTSLWRDSATLSGFVRLETDELGNTEDRPQMAGFRLDMTF